MNFELTHLVEIMLLSLHVLFSRKLLIEDNTFMSPTEDGTDILCGHPSHVKV